MDRASTTAEGWRDSDMDTATEHEIEIQLFGSLRVKLPNGAVLSGLGPHRGALVARLALQRNRPLTREELTDFLWPDDDPEEGRRKLRQIVYAIRRQLTEAGYSGGEPIIATRDSLQLDPAVAGVDVLEFERLVKQADHLPTSAERAVAYTQAVDLYQGELLPGLYQDLFVAERRRLARLCFDALRRLSLANAEAGDLSAAIGAAERAIELEPTGEEAHCDLMRLYARSGRQSAALGQYETLKRILRQELAMEPSASAARLAAELREAIQADPRPVLSTGMPMPSPTPGAPVPWSRRRLVALSVALAGLAGLFGILRPSTVGREAHGPQVQASPSAAEWVYRYAPPRGYRDSEASAVAIDPSGCICAVGMVRTAKQDVNFLLVKLDPRGRLLWEREYNGPGNDLDRALCMAVDERGGIIAVGDSDNGHGNGTTRLSGTDWAIVRYDADGRPSRSWPDIGYGTGVRRYNGPADGEDTPRKVLVDAAGDIYVGGDSRGKRDPAWAVVKYSPRGEVAWSYRSDAAGRRAETFGDMAACAGGGIAVTGTVRTAPESGPETAVVTEMLSPDGKRAWERLWGEANQADDSGKAVIVGKSHLLVVAQGRGTPGTFTRDRTGAMVLDYSFSGDLAWARGAASDSDHLDRVLAALPSGPGNGAITSTMLLGEHRGPKGRENRLVLKGDDGTSLWSFSYGTNFGDDGIARMAAASGKSFLTGSLLNVCPGDGKASAAAWVTLGVAPNGRIEREWLHRGSGNRMAPARALAITVRAAGAATGPERIIVAGQAPSDGREDLEVVCYAP